MWSADEALRGCIDPASRQGVGFGVGAEGGTLTIRHGVDPVLVQTRRDGVHLGLARGLLHLPPLLGQSALHHRGLG